MVFLWMKARFIKPQRKIEAQPVKKAVVKRALQTAERVQLK